MKDIIEMNTQLIHLYYPTLHTVLWPGNVFHGLDLIRIAASKNCSPADCSTALLFLAHEGYISHRKFRPTHSQAAFMRLEIGVHKHDATNPPNAGNASAFDWYVEKNWPTEIETEQDSLVQAIKAISETGHQVHIPQRPGKVTL